MPQTALTSALNATILTGNGNEGLLLNDMGNTLIKDSITGNIMSLSNGFIPLGMKERGGILYIASYNPQTKEGELGTIPSPIIAYTYNKSEEDTSLTISDIKNSDSSEETLVDDRLYKSQIYILSDHIFHGGDKFIVILNLDLKDLDVYNKPKTTERKIVPNKIVSDPADPSIKTVHFPQITNSKNRGWFKIKLFALGINGEDPKELTSITNEAQEYYTTSGKKTSDYWFINSNDVEGDFNLNLNRTRTSGLFRTFPNIQSGRLAIQFEVEKPEHLEYLYNTQYNKNLPQLIALRTAEGFNYYVAVHGFKYNGLCAILPDKIKVKCNLPIYKSSSYEDGYIIDDSTSYTEITIYPSPNPNLGAKNNNSQSLTTDFINLYPAAYETSGIEHAYLSNISDNKFIISRYRHSSNTEFTNYSSNKDALFFIKLDSFDKDIEVNVDLYTTDFTINIGDPVSYVKYDSYKLPVFNPLVEEGQDDVDRETTRQKLIITGSDNDEYDIELFGGDSQEGKNKCFVCSDDQGVILEYNKNTRKYEPKKKLKDNAFNDDFTDFSSEYKDENTRENCLSDEDALVSDYSSMKNWIYPITKLWLGDIETGDLTSGTWIYNSYFFLYGAVPDHQSSKKYLKEYNEDGLPTYCLPSQPQIDFNLDGERKTIPCLFPICYTTSTSGDSDGMYREAAELKHKSRQFINSNGLTTANLKEYCLFDTNLFFFSKEFEELNIDKLLEMTNCEYTYVRSTDDSKLFFSEPMFQTGGELHLWDNYDKIIVNSRYLPLEFKKSITKISGRTDNNTKYYNIDNFNSITGDDRTYPFFCSIDGKSRGYALGTVAAISPPLAMSAPFMCFLAKSAPGFIRADNSDQTLLDMQLLNNKYSKLYLYTNPIKCTFINKGQSAITVNYLNLNNVGHPFGLYVGYLWSDGKNIFNTSSHDGVWRECQPLNVLCNFKTNLNYEDDTEILLSELKHSSTDIRFDHSTDVLGIGKFALDVNIPINHNKVNIETICRIAADDKIADLYFPDKDIEDNIYTNTIGYIGHVVKGGKELRYVGDLGWRGHDKATDTDLNMSAWDWLSRNLEATNILTISRAQLFIDKSLSDFSCANRSDYNIDYLLSLKNNYGITFLNGIIPTQSISNVNIENLLAGGEIEDIAKMSDLRIDEITPADIDFISSSELLNNSFLNENGYLQTITNNNITIKFEQIHLSEGWYVFNINYNYASDGDLSIGFSITGERNELTTLKENQHLIVIYIPDSRDVNPLLIIERTNLIRYIKNCGLYKVNEGVIDLKDVNIKNVTANSTEAEKQNILSKVILPAVFCFKEEYSDGSRIGCIDEEYKGFQALPNKSYQLVVGVYTLSTEPDKNGNYIYANFIEDSLPAELCNDNKGELLKYIENNIIKDKLEIRHSV